jgi:alpha-beta hydrolase superfamily lysophospholipase
VIRVTTDDGISRASREFLERRASMIEATFAGTEGRVFYRRWDPLGEPKRIVHIVHGYAEHGGRYGHVAAGLNVDGAVVVADDHIGHGCSDGERGVITDFDHVLDDLHTLSGIVRADHPGLPLVLIGHSMGGLLSARYAERWPNEVAGVAFCGSVIGDWQWARDVITAPDIPHVEFDPEAISRDPAAGDSYASDPLVYHGQYKRPLLVAEVAALDAYADNVEQLTMSVAVFHGTADPFVPYERSVQAVRDMPTDDVTVHLYDDGRHEILNDINKDEVIGDLAAWVRRFG